MHQEQSNEVRNRILLSLGSNWQAEQHMQLAMQLLQARFHTLRFSEAIWMEALNYPQSVGPFLNRVAEGWVCERPEEIQACLKSIECQLGRRSEQKAAGVVVIDLDLLQWNDRILKPADLQRPYVRSGLASLGIPTDQA